MRPKRRWAGSVPCLLPLVERVDDVPVRESPHYDMLRAAGFEFDQTVSW